MKIKGLFSGIIYGLVAHIGCIGFIVFSILGVTTATTFFRPILLNRYFFHILILISFVFATVSAILYFRKQGFISLSSKEGEWEFEVVPKGIKKKWRYLLILYGTTIGINLLLFMFIFPVISNVDSETSFVAAISSTFQKEADVQIEEGENFLGLKVDIPCPGHAPLIRGDLEEINGVTKVGYRTPNNFDVNYEPETTSKEEIVSLNVFQTYKATVTQEEKGVQEQNNPENQPITNDKNTSGATGSTACGCGSSGCGSGNTGSCCGGI